MKTTFTFLFAVLTAMNSYSQGFWTQRADYPQPGRLNASGFTIGDKGYFTLGSGSSFYNSTDLVEYDPATDTWTQKPAFPGSLRQSSNVFVIDSVAYFCSGSYWSGTPNNYTSFQDVWAFNATTNTWTQRNNFPGTGRMGGFAFSYQGKGYLGLGLDQNNNFLNDFWEYNPVLDAWVQKANFPGTASKSGFSFSIGKYGYIGLGYDASVNPVLEIWSYDASTDTWTQRNNFPSSGRCWIGYFAMNNRGYVVSGTIVSTMTNTTDFWEYTPISDSWQQLPAFPAAGRKAGSAFCVNNKGYFGLGYSGSYTQDFWEYTPSWWSLPENIAEDKIKISPNPATDNISIENNMTWEKGTLKIFDVMGRCIMLKNTDETSGKIVISIEDIQLGKYVVEIISAKMNAKKTFIKM